MSAGYVIDLMPGSALSVTMRSIGDADDVYVITDDVIKQRTLFVVMLSLMLATAVVPEACNAVVKSNCKLAKEAGKTI